MSPTHHLTEKAGVVDGKIPVNLLPDNLNFGSTRFAVSLSPQAIINAPLGNRPVDWDEEDCDAPVLALLANVPEHWPGYFGNLYPTSVNTNCIQVQPGLRVAYADSNKVGISKFLLSPVLLNLANAHDGPHYIYAEFDEEGNYLLFGYSSSDSTKKVISMPPFTGETLAGWGTITASSYDSTFFPWEAFDNTDANSWRSSTLPATLNCNLIKQRYLSSYRIHCNEPQYYPTRWEVYADGVLVDEQLDGSVLVNGTAIVTLPQPVPCTVLTVKVIAGGGNKAKISEFTPMFRAEAWYDSPSKTMYDALGNPIRRTYIGFGVVYQGNLVDVHSYSLGSETYVPVNRGNPVRDDQYHIEHKPYLEFEGTGQVWSAIDEEWYRTDQGPISLAADNNPLSVAVDENKNGLMVMTTLSLTANTDRRFTNFFGDHANSNVIETFVRVRVSKKF